MTTWKVDVAAVRDVVAAQSAAAGELTASATQLATALETARRASADCDDVHGALTTFVRRHDASAGRIQAHVGAVLSAAGAATAAFVVGDEEMADNAYRAAAHPVPALSGGGAR